MRMCTSPNWAGARRSASCGRYIPSGLGLNGLAIGNFGLSRGHFRPCWRRLQALLEEFLQVQLASWPVITSSLVCASRSSRKTWPSFLHESWQRAESFAFVAAALGLTARPTIGVGRGSAAASRPPACCPCAAPRSWSSATRSPGPADSTGVVLSACTVKSGPSFSPLRIGRFRRNRGHPIFHGAGEDAGYS